jgi:hypothetical protein
MALVTLPTGGLANISWRLPRHPTFAVRSGWTGKQQVVDIGATLGFQAEVTVAPKTVAQARAWVAFFAALKGLTNEFVLPITAFAQSATATATVNGGGQTGATLSIGGLPNSTTVLPAGAFISVGTIGAGTSRLYALTAALTSNGSGVAAASIEPEISVAYANGAAVRIASPGAVMRLLSPDTGFSLEPGSVVRPFAFQCEEVI